MNALRLKRFRRSLGAIAVMLVGLAAVGYWQLSRIRPAEAVAYTAWRQTAAPVTQRGAALFAFGDLGALDLDTLETAAVPWPVLSAALALREVDGQADQVQAHHVATALKRFGFLYPKELAGQAGLAPALEAPLGLSIGIIERAVPPLRLTALNIGCAACHAGVSYRPDGLPDPTRVALGTPNTSLNLEAFTRGAYEAMKRAIADKPAMWTAIRRLNPDMTWREQLTLRWIALPKARARLSVLAANIDRPLPFPNGAPGLTNGVAALKYQLGLMPRDHFVEGVGFVSIPDLGHRFFRSALLADGAYALKGEARFRPIDDAEASVREPRRFAALASFFMVPSMGMTPERAEAAIPALTEVLAFVRDYRSPRFPGAIDRALATQGRDVYARACARCHGAYDASTDNPTLKLFPNWAGDVGTDASRAAAFDEKLAASVGRTLHGQRYLDAAATGRTVAPLLSGVWATAPYFVNGSVPTLRHLLEPQTRPIRFMVGGHRLDLVRLGIAGELDANGDWLYAADYRPFSEPVLIDTARPGFSNRGHDAEVRDLTGAERDALLEYLKLL